MKHFRAMLKLNPGDNQGIRYLLMSLRLSRQTSNLSRRSCQRHYGRAVFDIEDEYFVKVDLWLIGSVAITLMDFFFGVAGQVAGGGHAVMEFRPDFQRTIQGLAAENNALLAEMQASDRFLLSPLMTLA